MDAQFRVADLTRRHAAERGDRPALTQGDRMLTYARLDERANRIANALRADGVGEGDRIAVLDKNSIETVEILVGAWKLGAVLIPLNWLKRELRRSYAQAAPRDRADTTPRPRRPRRAGRRGHGPRPPSGNRSAAS